MILALLLQAAAPIDTVKSEGEPEEAKGVSAEQAVKMPAFNPGAIVRLMRKTRKSQEAGSSTQSFRMDYLLWINPNGDVETCVPFRVVGSKTYARKSCNRLKRLKVSPALGMDGKPIHASYASEYAIQYIRRRSDMDDRRVGQRYDMELPFKKFWSYPLVTTFVQVEANGSVSYCQAQWKAESDEETETNTRICDFLKSVPLHIRQDTSGNSVPYLRTVTVKLTD